VESTGAIDDAIADGAYIRALQQLADCAAVEVVNGDREGCRQSCICPPQRL
jgi:hypothetical protein